MKFTHFLGADISKGKLDFCLFDGESILISTDCSNDHKPMKIFFQQLIKHQLISKDNLVICAEHTGRYGFHLMHVATELGLNLWLENPATVKWSSGVQRGKNDKIDAERLAVYAYRFIDRVKLYNPDNEVIGELKQLNAERELLVADRAKYTGQLRDQARFTPKHIFKQKRNRLERLINVLSISIQEIERQIEKLISNNLVYKQQFDQITSIQGIGTQLAVCVITTTHGFTKFKDPRAYCCHAGVAPFAYTSGSSIRSGWKVSHRANKRIKSLLHMAALSAVRYNLDMKAFYERKVKEGKSKMSVLNAVRAKLVHRIFAIIRDNRKYEDFYVNSLG